jgi:deoxycytidine triphosphate deaminase
VSFLTGVEIRRRIESGDIEIYSLDASQPFSSDSQVTEDSIDLRLAPIAIAAHPGTRSLDYLDPDLAKAYEALEIPAGGIEVQPLEPLLTQTLEMVCLPDSLTGLVVTRSTFARMGIMATCMAPKFCPGIRWAFPLQIVNLNRFPVRIYPYAPMVQLLVSSMIGEPIGYRGRYQDSSTPSPPIVTDRERESLSQLNPQAVNRTFHIINKDNRTRLAATSPSGESSPSMTNESSLSRLAAWTTWKARHAAILVVISTLAAGAFGLAGNLLAGGKLMYWQVFSLVLLVVTGGLFTGVALLLQAMWDAQSTNRSSDFSLDTRE